jgi:hypothetical protein
MKPMTEFRSDAGATLQRSRHERSSEMTKEEDVSETTEEEDASKSEELRKAADKVIEDLVKIAFANVLDFARFEPDGSVHIYDWKKAREIGARVSVVSRTVGRGKNARQVRTTKIKMPDKFPALCKLLDRLDPTRR